MTEFEMAYLLTDMQSMFAAQGATTTSIVSGFLIVSYTVAHRLTRVMVAALLIMYSWWTLGIVLTTSRQVISSSGLILKNARLRCRG